MWFFLVNLKYLNNCVIYFNIHQESCLFFIDSVLRFGRFWLLAKVSPVKVVLWSYEQDIPVDKVSCVFFSVRHATEKS